MNDFVKKKSFISMESVMSLKIHCHINCTITELYGWMDVTVYVCVT